MPHHHHRRRQLDVYDDTQYAAHPSEQITVHHHPSPSRERRRRNRTPDSQLALDPLHPMSDAMARMERDFARAFESPFGGGLFGPMSGIMSSFDRMFDDFASASAAANGSYYYESSTTTVGPDGRVRQETVRTTPDADGNPQTSRFVSEGDHVRDYDPYHRHAIQGSRRHPLEDDVVVEEVDEDDDCLSPSRRRHDARGRNDASDEERSRSHEYDDRQNNPMNWVKERIGRWRSRR
eukprot:TRINITY_DN70_c0_g1_i1.p1 TRINITY_DN70_c0_g1~~TRINITY_DN70_c0_g1_i1.p1  ORF type:complete len:236 (-),score=39.39 TRINITY_DN70_c0_g1_i1:593-1300(-)